MGLGVQIAEYCILQLLHGFDYIAPTRRYLDAICTRTDWELAFPNCDKVSKCTGPWNHDVNELSYLCTGAVTEHVSRDWRI